MKKNIFYFLFFCTFILVQCKKKDSNFVQPIDNDSTEQKESNIRFPIDLVLIYHGGATSKVWTADNIKPYVYREKNKKVDFLFDGFLFLELRTFMEGVNYNLDGDSKRGETSTKLVWKDYLKRTFKKGRGPDALNEVLKKLHNKEFDPDYKRKVVLTIPYPTDNQTNWGKLNGSSLDFHVDFARAQAANWFIDELIKEWKKKDYQYLELAGFYWLREEAFSPYDREVISYIRKHISNINNEEEQKYDFYWIPYNGAGHANKWKDMGFDIAYMQPNYFFSTDYPYSRLTGAIDFAKLHGLGMEMEFDGKLYEGDNQTAYRQRFYDYLDEFNENGIWENKHIAYYEGGGAWLQMSKSGDTDVKEAYEALSQILADRKENYKKFK